MKKIISTSFLWAVLVFLSASNSFSLGDLENPEISSQFTIPEEHGRGVSPEALAKKEAEARKRNERINMLIDQCEKRQKAIVEILDQLGPDTASALQGEKRSENTIRRQKTRLLSCEQQIKTNCARVCVDESSEEFSCIPRCRTCIDQNYSLKLPTGRTNYFSKCQE